MQATFLQTSTRVVRLLRAPSFLSFLLNRYDLDEHSQHTSGLDDAKYRDNGVTADMFYVQGYGAINIQNALSAKF